LRRMTRFAACLTLLSSLLYGALANAADSGPLFHIGYLDDPGSGLVQHAADRGGFRAVGLRVELVKTDSAENALALLKSCAIDAAAVDSISALADIARDGRIAIFSGSGHLPATVNSLDANGKTPDKTPAERIVIVALRERLLSERQLFNRVSDALIRAYASYYRQQEKAPGEIRQNPGPNSAGTAIVLLDPNPGYDDLARLWKERGLQREGQPRDYLATHINEEYFCDALYLLLERAPDDPALLLLLNRAVCVPNCCSIYKQSLSISAEN